MIEAYRVGVNLALSGSIAGDLGKVASQFDALNKVIQRSQVAVNELASGMRALSRVGQSAADAWTKAATAMERAARATRQSASSGGMAPSGGGGSSGSIAGEIATALASRSMALVPWHGGAGPVFGPQGGGTYPRIGSSGGALAAVNGGTFAGAAGTGGALMAGGGGRGGGGIPLNYNAGSSFPQMPGHSDLMAATVGFGAVGAGLLAFTKAVTDAGIEAGHLQTQLRSLGFTQEEASRARALAMAEQRATPGITAPGVLEIIKDLMTVTQKSSEALNPDIIRGFSRAGVVLSAAGKGNAISELFKSMQAGELRGVLRADESGEISTEALQGFIKNVITTTLITGGRVGPSELLQTIKSSGLGGAMMSDRSLFADMIAPILSMGASRAGTGIQAFASQFTAGKMSDAAVKLMLRMGLVENLPANAGSTAEMQFAYLKPMYKTGIGQWALPQNMMPYRDNPDLNPGQHPIDFMMKVLLPAMDAYNLKSNGAPRDDEDKMAQRMAMALALSSRIPAGNLIGDVIRNMPLIARDREAFEKGGDRDAFANAQTDPRVKMQALSAALNGLLTALSGPIMDTAIGVLSNLTGALNRLSAWAEAHPAIAGRIVELATALGTLAAAIAGISAVLFVAGPMLRVANWGLQTAGVAGSKGAAVAAAAGGGLLSRLAGRVLGPLGLGLAGYDAAKMTGGIFSDIGDTINGRLPGSLANRGSAAPAGTTAAPTTVNLTGPVNIDGKKVGDIIANNIAKGASGPSSGTTGFDIRAGTAGGLMAIP